MIRSGQAATGAYLACPDFAPYRYSWFRDGAFIADAMSRAGEADSAGAFFDWGAGVLEARAEPILAGAPLNARYTVDGREADVEWLEYQLDGYGLWLWALRGHIDRHGAEEARWERGAELACAYLVRHLDRPCVDWWEEREGRHPTTLGCVAAGLRAWERPEAERAAEAALAVLPAAPLDASMLALMEPLGIVEQGTSLLSRVEEHLVSPGGGVHRNAADTYYGGGEWLLLTALLGRQHAAHGRPDEARRALAWVEAHATPEGHLPEQSQDHLLAPERLPEWVERWGPPASPLLWSHAFHLDLVHAVDSPATSLI